MRSDTDERVLGSEIRIIRVVGRYAIARFEVDEMCCSRRVIVEVCQ